MSYHVIRAEHLSKRYYIGRPQKYQTFRETLIRSASAPIRRATSLLRGQATGASELDKAILALDDVTFDIERGEVVGIIGRNGAGKSTLLKILSRITEPTAGRVCIRGHVGSLLEVGTGFHPELTGRENIYLNGALLGMRRAAIDRKFDEIVDFAEIENFLDTPVKHYSSGMYVRLAFAVAAHLEPDVLLVDEVLAVGDVAFQKKCLGKMSNVAHSGRTILFVSHNMAAISSLCTRAFLLDRGKLVTSGKVPDVISHYLDATMHMTSIPLPERVDRQGNGRLRFTDVAFVNGDNSTSTAAVSGQPLRIILSYATADGREVRNVDMDLAFYGQYGQLMFFCKVQLARGKFEVLPPKGQVVCHIPRFPLSPGRYRFKLWCQANREMADRIEDAGVLTVVAGDFYGTGNLPSKNPEGIVMVDHSWEVVQ